MYESNDARRESETTSKRDAERCRQDECSANDITENNDGEDEVEKQEDGRTRGV